MSKYVKLEDAIHNINLEVTGRKEYTGDMKANLFFALDDLPTIEVSEDCISREWVKGICEAMLDEEMLGHMLGYIEDAPSVIPKAKEGEWIYGEHDVAMCDGYRCDRCDFFVPWDYEHKFIDFINDYHFCPNCGAKMKG